MKNNKLKSVLFFMFITVFFTAFLNIANTHPAFSYKTLNKKSVAVKKNKRKNIEKVYKKYGAYIIKKDVVLKLNKNYELREYVAESLKILSQRGINKYSEVVIPFSTKYQKIKFLYAYTLLNGMFKIPIGKHAINIVSPGFAVNYPAYSDIKYLTLSMPAVEDGSIINFSYEINNFKPLIKNGVFYTNYFSYDIPVKKINFSLVYSSGFKLNLYLHNIKKSYLLRKTVLLKNKKFTELSISANHVSAIKKESNMPPEKNLRKYISISTYTSWRILLNKINAMFEKAEKPDKNIVKFVKSAIKKYKNKDNGGIIEERKEAAAIYDKFVKTFRYAGIGYGINGYMPDDAPVVFNDGYGDSKSLAALLIAMLKTAKINAYPILIASLNTTSFNKKTISPKQFDSVLVGLTFKENGRYVRSYLYPDSSSYKAFNIPFELSGRNGAAILGQNKFKFIKTPSEKPKQNEKIFLFKGKINKNGMLSGTVSVKYKGVYSNYERSSLKNINHYEKKIKVYNSLYNFLPGAQIKDFNFKNLRNINKNLKLIIKIKDKNYGTKNADKLLFHSVLPIDSGLLGLVLKGKRRYNLIIGYPFEHKGLIVIKLPAKSYIYYIPKELKLKGNSSSAYSKCKFLNNKAELICSYKFESEKLAVSKEEYKRYRKIIRSYLQYMKNYFIAVSNVYFY
jgi:hypothetical protein